MLVEYYAIYKQKLKISTKLSKIEPQILNKNKFHEIVFFSLKISSHIST